MNESSTCSWMLPWSLSKSFHLILMVASSRCKALISIWLMLSCIGWDWGVAALVLVLAVGCDEVSAPAVGSREVTLTLSTLLRSSFTKLLTSVTVLRIFSCSQKRTCTTNRSGKRSFWEACVQASRDNRWQLRMRHRRFLSCSDKLGCICTSGHIHIRCCLQEIVRKLTIHRVAV